MPVKKHVIHRYQTADDIDRYQVTTDRVLGGHTSCSFSLKQYEFFSSGARGWRVHRRVVVAASARPSSSSPPRVLRCPAGVFQGVIDYHDDNPDSRGGFASFRTKPEERVRDLSSFEALEMRIKTDGRPCVAVVRQA